MKCIVSYYPSKNTIFGIYDSVEEAVSNVKFLNVFGKMCGTEKLCVGKVELTEEEYKRILRNGG